jgi:hypothetical protein
VVIECRRSTFVLQKLSSRVEGWAEWYEPRQREMRSDPLTRYFADLRTQIEKEGLPAAMAELVDFETGVTVGDAACGEDEFGIWTAGAVRPSVQIESGELDRDRFVLRNFRLADPPTSHLGEDLIDFRFVSLGERAIRYLRDRIVSPARGAFTPSPPASGAV